MSSCHHRIGRTSRQSGFALVIALTLMAFILLLLLSISTLVRVETSVARNSLDQVEARQNALLAAYVALGELSKAAGPDQRVSARADIVASDAPYWTGVWSSDPDPGDGSTASTAEIKDRPPIQWLVSVPNEGEPNLLQSFLNPDIDAIPDGSVLLYEHPDSPIILPTEPIEVGRSGAGAYAYWVSDEGMKASVALPQESSSMRDTNLRARNPSSMELFVVDDFPAPDEDEIEGIREQLGRIPSLEYLSAVVDVADDVVLERSHDLTPVALSVPANVRDGGLKKDLGAAFSDAAGSWQKLLDFHGDAQLFPPASGLQSELDTGGPKWSQLRSFYEYRPEADGSLRPLESTDDQSGVGPVISHFSLHHHIIFFDVGGAQYRPRLCVFPIFVLWNPYNKPLAPETYFLKVTDNSIVSNKDSLDMEIQARVFLDGDDGAADTITYEDNGGETRGFKESALFPNTVEAPYFFRIDSGVIPPGEALIFSAGSAVTELPADPEAPITLSVGYNSGHFFYKDAPDTMDMSRLMAGEANLTHFALHMRSANFLRVRLAKESQQNLEDEVLLQHVSGQNSFVTGSGGGSQAAVKWPGTLSMLVPAGQEQDAIIAGHPAYDQTSFPASGAYMHLKMARNYTEVNNNDDLTTSQRENMPYIKYVANSNPRAPRSSKGVLEQMGGGNNDGPDMAFNPTYFGNSEMYHYLRLLPANHSYTTFLSGEESIDLGFSDDPSELVDRGWILFEVPEDRSHFLSVADLSMANLTQPLVGANRFYKNPILNYNIQNLWPAYSIGNSLQDPRIEAESAVRGTWPEGSANADGYFHYDTSYLLNEALWNAYFFSGFDDDPAVGGSWNVRYLLGENFVHDFDQSAVDTLVAGSFNVNSTSVEAWKAFLASTRRKTVQYEGDSFADHDEIPLLRMDAPFAGPTPRDRDSETSEVYNGFLALESEDIEALAEAVVEQVKARGPFISLAHFVNRVLADPDYRSDKEADYAASSNEGQTAMMVGALQAAIDLSAVNEEARDGTGRFNDPSYEMSEAELSDFYVHMSVDASLGDRAAANPGYLSQLDLLEQIGSLINVRSDTFRIHAYGETHDGISGEASARARCVVTVQRVAEFVDPGDVPEAEMNTLSTTNEKFGRRFRIIDFQWIQPNI